ncbi:MAG: PAC2 family protein [Candidatus Omnitrophica bacterium]|nr:PAC2 family protein [Candidatus Omnitrophota bacterium]
MEGITYLKKPRLKSPYLIVAWPGMGEVAFRAATYLIDTLKAEEFASIPPADFFYLTDVVVQKGVFALPQLPFSKFYFWKNKDTAHDIIIFVSNAQPDLAKAQEYCEKILLLAKAMKVERVISFAAMPQAIDHTQQPQVWYASSSEQVNAFLKKYTLQLLPEGQVSGLNGLFLGLAKKEGFEGFCLLGEIPLYTIQIENPKASRAVLEAFAAIARIPLDLNGLAEQEHLVENQINNLLEYLKVGPAPGPIGDEEIEKIKKSLSQLTRLPSSIKEKIDKLFIQAGQDISKANELKSELDKWNVYKEYEDRFLDLFKKNKEKNN